MRILVIAKRFPAVSQTFVRLHVESLLDLGHEVTVMAAPGDVSASAPNSGRVVNRLLPIELPRGNIAQRICQSIRQIPLDFRSIKLLSIMAADYIRGRSAGATGAALPLAAALCRHADWDVVHVHFGNQALPVAQLCDAGFVRVPLVATFHGTDLNAQHKVPRCQLYARVFRAARMLTVGTSHMALHMVECGVPVGKYRVLPMGVDVSRFEQPRPNQRTGSGGRLITIGRLVECKGIEYAIRAVANLRAERQDVTLDVIGDGPLRQELEQLCADLGVSSAVKFHGALEHDRVLALLQESDIYVQPGIIASDGQREGQGIVVAEAEATRLPVVASRVGGIPEIVAEGESAFLVEPKDVSALADRLSLLIQDSELRARMGAAGREFVERRLSQEALAREWVSIYRSIQTGRS